MTFVSELDLAKRALRRYADKGFCFDEGECHSFYPETGPQTTFDVRPEFNDLNLDDFEGRWGPIDPAPGRRDRHAATIRIAETVPQMLSGLNPRVEHKSQACSSRRIRMSPQILRYTFGVTCSPPTGSGIEHLVKVKIVPKTKRPRFKLDKADVKVSCSCPAWVWWGSEWHAKQRKYLDQKLRGSGSAPNIRDPDRVNMVCKHGLIVLNRLREWTLTHPAHR